MTSKQRQKILDSIHSGDPIIALFSIKSGGTSLNLQKIHQIIILEPQWNPVHEDQAVG